MADPAVFIPLVEAAEFTDEQRELVGDWSDMNFVRLIVRNPQLFRVLMPFINRMIAESQLPPRDRQVVVMRTLARGDDYYEAIHHRRISKNAGLDDALIEAVCAGDGDALTDFDKVLIRAADELFDNRLISPPTWQALSERYSHAQLLELVSLTGLYVLMNMLTRTSDLALEPGEEFESMGQRRDYI